MRADWSPSPSKPAEPQTPAAAPTADPDQRERVTDKDSPARLARHRLSVLQLAEELGSITRACKKAGMDRTRFYEWERRFQTHGLAGLKDLPRSPRAIQPPPLVHGNFPFQYTGVVLFGNVHDLAIFGDDASVL